MELAKLGESDWKLHGQSFFRYTLIEIYSFPKFEGEWKSSPYEVHQLPTDH